MAFLTTRAQRQFRRAAAASAAAALACAAAVLPARAQTSGGGDNDPLVDTVAKGRGRINYAAGIAKATGNGAAPTRSDISPVQARLMALGAARADALRTLAMTVSAIQVTATTKVKNYELESDVVETRLSAILQAPRLVSEVVNTDGSATVILELPLYGANSVASAVLPEVLGQGGDAGSTAPAAGYSAFRGPDQPALPIARPVAARAPTTLPLGVNPGPTPASDPGPFTSLIVDCRGLNIEAIMSPKLMDTTGREIYGTVRVTPDYAIETGIVSYPRSLAEALRSARAGSHPLIVKAIRASDKFRFNPCVALEDGDRILAANNRDGFLPQTRVIFLVDALK